MHFGRKTGRKRRLTRNKKRVNSLQRVCSRFALAETGGFSHSDFFGVVWSSCFSCSGCFGALVTDWEEDHEETASDAHAKRLTSRQWLDSLELMSIVGGFSLACSGRSMPGHFEKPRRKRPLRRTHKVKVPTCNKTAMAT